MYGSYHHIVAANKPDAGNTQTIDIAGNVCESGDFFARDRPMPEIEEGDVLAIFNAGAYAFSMSSQYNSRPKTMEVLVNKGESEIVRERETFADVLLTKCAYKAFKIVYSCNLKRIKDEFKKKSNFQRCMDLETTTL